MGADLRPGAGKHPVPADSVAPAWERRQRSWSPGGRSFTAGHAELPDGDLAAAIDEQPVPDHRTEVEGDAGGFHRDGGGARSGGGGGVDRTGIR